MIDYLFIALSSLLVIWLIHYFALVDLARQVLATTRQANAVAADEKLSDKQKEIQTQQAATRLMKLFGQMLLKGALAFALPVLPIYALAEFDLVDINHIMAVMTSLEFIAVFTVLFILSVVKGKRV